MQLKLHMITIDNLVPADHVVRKREAMLGLTFVYEDTGSLYNHKYSRPPIDPVMLAKYLLVNRPFISSRGRI